MEEGNQHRSRTRRGERGSVVIPEKNEGFGNLTMKQIVAETAKKEKAVNLEPKKQKNKTLQEIKELEALIPILEKIDHEEEKVQTPEVSKTENEATPDDSLELNDIKKKKIVYLEEELERQKKLLEFEKSKNSSEEIIKTIENHIKLTEETLANLKNTEKVASAPIEPAVVDPETLTSEPETISQSLHLKEIDLEALPEKVKKIVEEEIKKIEQSLEHHKQKNNELNTQIALQDKNLLESDPIKYWIKQKNREIQLLNEILEDKTLTENDRKGLKITFDKKVKKIELVIEALQSVGAKNLEKETKQDQITIEETPIPVVSGYSYADGGTPEAPLAAPEVAPVATDEDKKVETSALTEEEWDNFVHTGKVSENVLNKIAEKIVSGQPSSKKEVAVAATYSKEIETILNTRLIIPAPEVATPTTIPEAIPAPTLLEDIEYKLNEARARYAEEYKKFLAKANKLTRAKRFVFGTKFKDSEIPPELKELEKEYEKATIELGQKMYEEEEEKLSKDSSLSEDEKKSKLTGYKQDKIFTRVIIEEQNILNALKVENLPPKEKGVLKKSLDWYIEQPRAVRIGISFALSGTFAMFFLPSSVAAAGGTAAYWGIKGMRTLASLGVGQGTGKLHDKAYNFLFKEKKAIKGKKAREELLKIFEEEPLDASLTKSKKEYAKILEREQNAKRNRLISKAMIGIAVGGLTSYGMGYGASHFSHNSADQLQTPGVNNNQPDMAGARVQNEADLKSLVGTRMATMLGYKPTESLAINQDMNYSAPGVENEISQNINSAPGAGHEISHDFSVKLGEGGVPKNLETVYNEISADHMNVPTNGIVDEEFATKSLNMAANLVRLTEHHNVAGVSADDFEKVATFKDGVLQIKNPTDFNEIVSKLQTHSDELWTKGVLQSDGAAITQIPKISHGNWLKIVHAEGMHEGTALDGTPKIATGLLGHQEIDTEHIKNFNDSEMVKSAIEKGHEKLVADTRAQVIEHIDKEATTPTPEPQSQPQPESEPEPEITPESDSPEDIANNKQLSDALRKQGYTGDPTDRKAIDEFFKKLRDDSTESGSLKADTTGPTVEQNDFAQRHADFIGKNPSDLNINELMQAYETRQKNIDFIFKDSSHEPSEIWNELKSEKAFKIIDQTESQNPETRNLAEYIIKIRNFTGLEPKNSFFLFGKAKSVEDYVAQGLQKIVEKGQIEEFEASLRK